MTYVVDAHESKLETTPDRLGLMWRADPTFQSPEWTGGCLALSAGGNVPVVRLHSRQLPGRTHVDAYGSFASQETIGWNDNTLLIYLYNLIQLERFLDGFRRNQTSPKSV